MLDLNVYKQFCIKLGRRMVWTDHRWWAMFCFNAICWCFCIDYCDGNSRFFFWGWIFSPHTSVKFFVKSWFSYYAHKMFVCYHGNSPPKKVICWIHFICGHLEDMTIYNEISFSLQNSVGFFPSSAMWW